LEAKLVEEVINRQEYVEILGISIIKIKLNDMVSLLDEHVTNKQKAFVVTANPEIVLHAHENDEYGKCIKQATYVTADGIGVVKGAKILGESLPERVAGFDLFMKLLIKANERKQSIYLLGAEEHVLQKAMVEIQHQFPDLTIAGSQNGFFDWDSEALPNEIQQKKPDYVFVALGFPRQENWIASHFHNMDQGVFIGIGGSFDVLAGEVKRAPQIWQKMNLEWLYRLAKQPTRWRRMLALPRFAYKVIGEKWKQKS